MTDNTKSQSQKEPRKLIRHIKVINSLGLHARPAAMFVKTASVFQSEVTVTKDGNTVSGKSIMGLMTLQAECGSSLRVTAEGPDAAEVLDQLETLFLEKFKEE